MASTFAELYSDYRNIIKIYTEELDVTPQQYMRDYTRGMQKFQRETEYVENWVKVNRDPNTLQFQIPPDCLRIIEIRDQDGEKILSQDYVQFGRNVDKWDLGYLETPTDYVLRTGKIVPFVMTDNRKRNLPDWTTNPALPQWESQKIQRIWAVFNTTLYIYPEYKGDILYIYYIPDIHAFSNNSFQWAPWFAANAFENLFQTAQVNQLLAPYEDAFNKYAVSEYIRSKGSANYKVYLQEFWEEVQRAKLNKPTYFKEGVADYFFAPYS
ncbi:hypothetical protein [Caldisericum sp.]|uniref:hypothetical protein n=1 Tax=Caldisericum sp. TaxID=2499687 RepID=UPI003D0B2812